MLLPTHHQLGTESAQSFTLSIQVVPVQTFVTRQQHVIWSLQTARLSGIEQEPSQLSNQIALSLDIP